MASLPSSEGPGQPWTRTSFLARMLSPGLLFTDTGRHGATGSNTIGTSEESKASADLEAGPPGTVPITPLPPPPPPPLPQEFQQARLLQGDELCGHPSTAGRWEVISKSGARRGSVATLVVAAPSPLIVIVPADGTAPTRVDIWNVVSWGVWSEKPTVMLRVKGAQVNDPSWQQWSLAAADTNITNLATMKFSTASAAEAHAISDFLTSFTNSLCARRDVLPKDSRRATYSRQQVVPTSRAGASARPPPASEAIEGDFAASPASNSFSGSAGGSLATAETGSSKTKRWQTHRSSIVEPDELCCPIMATVFRDPVFVACSGATYEREAILRFWEDLGDSEVRDPLSNESISSRAIFTNWGKRREVSQFLEAYPDYCPSGWKHRDDIPRPPEVAGGRSGEGELEEHGGRRAPFVCFGSIVNGYCVCFLLVVFATALALMLYSMEGMPACVPQECSATDCWYAGHGGPVDDGLWSRRGGNWERVGKEPPVEYPHFDWN